MQDATGTGSGRKASLAGLFILALVQGLVILVTLVVVGLGAPPARQIAILLVGVGAAAVLLLVVLAQVVRDAWKPGRAAWALAVPVLDVAVHVIAFGPAGGTNACSPADEQLLRSVSPPAGVVLQDEPMYNQGSCSQEFVASIPLREVLDSYSVTLESQGWTIVAEDAQVQGGSGKGGASAMSGELAAQRGSDRFSILGEQIPDGSGGTSVSGPIRADVSG